jgi:hypothetical protein
MSVKQRLGLPDDYVENFSDLIGMGHALWNQLYRPDRGDGFAFRTMIQRMVVHEHLASAATASEMFPGVGLARWVDGACRTYECSSPEFFAALSMTEVSKDAYEDIRFPWPVFAVRIPDGLLGNYHTILVGHLQEIGLRYDPALERLVAPGLGLPKKRRDGLTVALTPESVNRTVNVGFLALLENTGAVASTHSYGGIADLLFETRPNEPPVGDASMVMTAEDERCIELATKVVVGALYTHQHSSHWTEGKKVSSLKRDPRFGPPDHRVIVVGRPLTVDVRPAVRAYIEHGHAAPSFQTLVSGHRKRQVIGVGRKGRKIIWVEPYWRGPKEAPILMRPYKVVG